jgi:modulator of FtsH protease HflK
MAANGDGEDGKKAGPWDNLGGSGGGKAAPTGPKQDLPTGAEKGGKAPPKNPWDPVAIDGGKSKNSGKGPSLEELLRRAGGGGNGGGGWGGLPKRANGRSIWPLIAGALVLLWVGLTSVHQLEPAESGVITRFGKYSRTVENGLSFTLPAPFETLVKINTAKDRTITIGGAPNSKEENFILTKDSNVIDMAYNVRWRVSDAENYLFQLDNPDDTVSEVAESAMRASVANFDLSQAIGTGRGDIQVDVRKRMQAILNSYRAGITVQGIDIQQSKEPSQVSEAFLAVNAAIQQRESNLNEARKYEQVVMERALGETNEFDKIYEQYRQAPEVTKRRIYYETMEQVLPKIDKTIVETGNVTPFLPLQEMKRRAEAAKPADIEVKGQK